MTTKCILCRGLIDDEEITQKVAEKQAKVSSLISEISAIRGREHLHHELEALHDPGTAEIALAAISREDEVLTVKLATLLGAMRERKTLHDALQSSQMTCEICEDLERKLAEIQPDYERLLAEVKNLCSDLEAKNAELKVRTTQAGKLERNSALIAEQDGLLKQKMKELVAFLSRKCRISEEVRTRSLI
jgi:chromosome segregation ATPase